MWVAEILKLLLETVGWAGRAHPHRALRLMDTAAVKQVTPIRENNAILGCARRDGRGNRMLTSLGSQNNLPEELTLPLRAGG